MADRSAFDSETARSGTFSEGILRFQSERQLAESHVIGRNRRVAALMCYLSLMRNHNPALAQAVVTCKAADFQDYNATNGNQAAHYMPGQICLRPQGQQNRQTPMALISDPDTAAKVGALFSRVQDLHANFNKADTYVEQFARPGIKRILADCCAEVVLSAGPSKDRVAASVRSAFDRWMRESIIAYNTAANAKLARAEGDNGPLPEGNTLEQLPDGTYDRVLNENAVTARNRVVRRGSRGVTTASDYETQSRILRIYMDATQTYAFPDTLRRDIEASFKP